MILCVGCGGGGGGCYGKNPISLYGGAGGGGSTLVTSYFQATAGLEYTITIGAGGAGSTEATFAQHGESTTITIGSDGYYCAIGGGGANYSGDEQGGAPYPYYRTSSGSRAPGSGGNRAEDGRMSYQGYLGGNKGSSSTSSGGGGGGGPKGIGANGGTYVEGVDGANGSSAAANTGAGGGGGAGAGGSDKTPGSGGNGGSGILTIFY
jgi:hypothetical protein